MARQRAHQPASVARRKRGVVGLPSRVLARQDRRVVWMGARGRAVAFVLTGCGGAGADGAPRSPRPPNLLPTTRAPRKSAQVRAQALRKSAWGPTSCRRLCQAVLRATLAATGALSSPRQRQLLQRPPLLRAQTASGDAIDVGGGGSSGSAQSSGGLAEGLDAGAAAAEAATGVPSGVQRFTVTASGGGLARFRKVGRTLVLQVAAVGPAEPSTLAAAAGDAGGVGEVASSPSEAVASPPRASAPPSPMSMLLVSRSPSGGSGGSGGSGAEEGAGTEGGRRAARRAGEDGGPAPARVAAPPGRPRRPASASVARGRTGHRGSVVEAAALLALARKYAAAAPPPGGPRGAHPRVGRPSRTARVIRPRVSR